MASESEAPRLGPAFPGSNSGNDAPFKTAEIVAIDGASDNDVIQGYHAVDPKISLFLLRDEDLENTCKTFENIVLQDQDGKDRTYFTPKAFYELEDFVSDLEWINAFAERLHDLEIDAAIEIDAEKRKARLIFPHEVDDAGEVVSPDFAKYCRKAGHACMPKFIRPISFDVRAVRYPARTVEPSGLD